MSRASALYRLQQVDTSIDQAKKRLAEVEAELAGDERLRAARLAFDEARRAQQQADAAWRAAEDAVATQRRKIEETEAKLYGGGEQNPKALQELQAEAEALGRHMATLEERLLEQMTVLEAAETQVGARQTTFELAEADAAGRQESLARERQVLNASLEDKELEREAALSGVDAESLRVYDSLRQAGGGLAVVPMLDSSCSACGVSLSASKAQEIRSGAKLLRCRQCGRLLVAG